jgi:hypothetical protein
VGARGSSPILELIADKYLLAGTDRFKIPELEKLPAFGAPLGDVQSPAPAVLELEEGWNFGGAVWNADASQAVMLLNPQGFLGSSPPSSMSVHTGTFEQDAQRSLTSWGRLASAHNFYGPSQAYLPDNGGQRYGMLVPAMFPAAITLAGEQASSGDSSVALRVHELSRGSETQLIVLHRLPRDRGSSRGGQAGQPLALAGEVLAAVSDRRLYLLPAATIDRDHLTAPPRFKLVQSPLVLGPRGQGTLKYALLDGEPPYDVKFTIFGSETRTSGKGSISVPLDVQDLTARILAMIPNWQWPAQRPGPGQEPKDPRVRVVDYVDAVTPLFKELIGREPRGVPYLVPAFVEATDRNLEIAQLAHSYFIEIPATTVVKALTDAAEGRVPQYIPRPAVARAAERDPEDRQRRLAELDQQLATSYSDGLREKNPHAEVDDAQLERRAERARGAADAAFERALSDFAATRTQQVRTWKDKKGHSTQATLKSAFADQVVLRLATGNEVTLPMSKLSEEDVKFIESSTKPTAVSPVHRQVVAMRLVLAAIQKHAGRTGGYPPSFIGDASGNRILSWRVAILPDLGANDLFRMFHFDEPWDSEHNRKLLAYMPAVFRMAEKDAPADRTAMVAFHSTNGVFTSGQSLTRRELAARQESPLIIAEVVPGSSTPWIQPADIDASQFAALDDVLQPYEGHYLVGNIDGAVLAAPAGTPEAAWRKAISRDDRTLSQIGFEDPMSLSAHPPAQAP